MDTRWNYTQQDNKNIVLWAYLTVFFAIPAVSFRILTEVSFDLWYGLHKDEIESQGGISDLFKKSKKKNSGAADA